MESFLPHKSNLEVTTAERKKVWEAASVARWYRPKMPIWVNSGVSCNEKGL
jgi:hypothetical protein